MTWRPPARHHPADCPELPISGPPPICQLRAHDAGCRPSRRRKASRAGALPTRPGVRTGTADMGAACDALHLTVLKRRFGVPSAR